VAALGLGLHECLQPLQFADLNEVVAQPTDENLARWIAARLEAPGIARVAVQSTAQQGADLDHQGAAHLWRRYEFQAAHRLPNVPVGHKCGRMHGHGFEVMLHARANAAGTGPILDYDRLDTAWAPWQQRLDLCCLNELEGLDNPTSEILSSWIWARLQPALPELSWVTVFETGTCGANFDGHHYRIWKEFSLDSAVRLRRAPAGSRYGHIHGHTFKLRLHLSAPIDTVLGWAMDFGDLKAVFDPTFEALDHRPLYEVSGLADTDTASLGDWIFRSVQPNLPQLSGVELYETLGCGALQFADPSAPPLPV
jgi:6-pyruvoyltetrahydropterin/6-carboxytetrahydropterin synthase